MTDTTSATVGNWAPEATSKATENASTPPLDETIEANEIRVTAQGKMRNYVAYAATIFSENKSHTVVLKGMGRVINKTVSLAEILKRRVKGLYQLAEIGSIEVVDQKPGKGEEEGEDVMRLLSVIKIVLTTDPEDRAKFQPPIDESEVEPVTTPLPKRTRLHKKRNKAKKTKNAKEASAPVKAPPADKPVEVKDATEDSVDDDKKNEKENKVKQKRKRANKKSKKASAAAAASAEKGAAVPNSEPKENGMTEVAVVAETKPVVEEAAKPVVEEAAKPVVEEAAKPVVEEAAKPVVEEAEEKATA